MKIKKILVLYKISTFEFLRRSFPPRNREIKRFAEAHQRHYKTLKQIEEFLTANKLFFRKARRGQPIEYRDYDLIITVGGDGTFLEAAHQATDQLVLGVNSDPRWSVGRFCAADISNFPSLLTSLLADKARLTGIQRLDLKLGSKHLRLRAVNDVLVCHQNPAGMSHYYLILDGKKEEQRSSGVWIATAAGSTGAIHSAGGQMLPLESREFQYLPRELYRGWGRVYKFTGSVLKPNTAICIASLMRDGVFFIDGAHQKIAFPFGQVLTVTPSRQLLSVVSRS